jgi:catechol 2,3-dioxygenase-like lactoylglutathione lyase family enzyme
VLGLEEVIHQPPRHVFFRCGETIVLLFRADQSSLSPDPHALPVPPHGADGSGHICFRSKGSELDDWIETLASAGIGVEADFHWPNGARSVYVRDPAGNSVEFAEAKLWEPAE